MLPSPSSFYRRDIDGLRGIAVLMVVLFHAGGLIRGGFVGVDVFFVISGYLITGILLREWESGSVDLARFWERRVRRIVPAAMAMTLVTLGLGYVLLLPDAFAKLGSSAMAHVLMVANVHFSRDVGYFADASEEKPLLHTWSLAVEEQFYLVLPLLIWSLHRFWHKREGVKGRELCFAVLAVLFVLSLGWSLYEIRHQQNRAFFWLPSRAWELLMGCLLAAAPIRLQAVSAVWRERARLIGALLLVAAAVMYHDGTKFPGEAALLPCVAAALIIWAGESPTTANSRLRRLLESRFLVGCGLISYSLYLWHWPLLAFWNYLDAGFAKPWVLAGRYLVVILSFGLAWLSWRWIETPIRQRVWLRSRVSVMTATLVAFALVFGLGLQVKMGQGMPTRIPAAVAAFVRGKEDMAARAWPTKRITTLKFEFPQLGASEAPLRFLLWGDSHAKSLAPAMIALGQQYGVRGKLAAFSATPPLLNFVNHSSASLDEKAPIWAEGVVQRVKSEGISEVILAASWAQYARQDAGALRDAMLLTLRRLQENSARVWIVLDVPVQMSSVPQSLALHALHQPFYPDPRRVATTKDQHDEENSVMLQLVPELEKAGARIIDPSVLSFDKDGRSLLEVEGQCLYADRDHLTNIGSLRLKSLFEPIFKH
jgi:peptidoglycan/LPS O-acetylase OafA/YrhL